MELNHLRRYVMAGQSVLLSRRTCGALALTVHLDGSIFLRRLPYLTSPIDSKACVEIHNCEYELPGSYYSIAFLICFPITDHSDKLACSLCARRGYCQLRNPIDDRRDLNHRVQSVLCRFPSTRDLLYFYVTR